MKKDVAEQLHSEIGSMFKIDRAAKQEAEGMIEVGIDRLVPFKEHPFKVERDGAFETLKNSIEENGIITPIVVREAADGLYEIISGHRRYTAAKELGKTIVPVIVKKIEDDDAMLSVIDSNLQREGMLPSERAKTYQARCDIMKEKGESIGDAVSEISRFTGVCERNIRRYLVIANLSDLLLEKLDNHTIKIMAGYELANLQSKEQDRIVNILEEGEKTVLDRKTAKKIVELYGEGVPTDEELYSLIHYGSDNRKEEQEVSLDYKRLSKWFPDCTRKEIVRRIYELLEKNYGGIPSV